MVPEHFQETFIPSTTHGETNSDGKGMRYLEWTYAPADQKQAIIVDFAFLLKDESGAVQIEYDRHVLGLFSREAWLSLLKEAAFQADIIEAPYREEGISYLNIIYAKK